MRLFVIVVLLFFFKDKVKSQQISMNFPVFESKSYEFILFQGSEQKTVYKGSIPQGGEFVLSVPGGYAPYHGMSRWLITGTKEGGGLDLYIPEKNFSVACDSKSPNEKNIIYTNNSGNTDFYNLIKQQDEIISRYELMKRAKTVFKKGDYSYLFFVKESDRQRKAFRIFQRSLRKRNDYTSEFIRIVNISNGVGTDLFDNEFDKALNIASYITKDLNWDYLYTSGHWWIVIGNWVSIYTNVLKDKDSFKRDFEQICLKLRDEKEYLDFISRVCYFLKEANNESYIQAIAPVIRSSGRVKEYKDLLEPYKS